MQNPVIAHKTIQDAILKYVGTAFGTASETFEKEGGKPKRRRCSIP